MKNSIWLYLLFVFFAFFQLGCNPGKFSSQQNDLTAVPLTFENPQNDLNPAPSVEPDIIDPDLDTEPPPLVIPDKPDIPVTPDIPDVKPEPSQPAVMSKLIYNAQRVMEIEGRKLGTACNIYVHRVLTVSGYNQSVYLANDFDVYAKKYFKSYRAEDFNRDLKGGEIERLRSYIWDQPERTPFIMQWSRSGVNGHIALVERIGEKLVIYQASLGTRTAHKDQTTPAILLNGYSRRQLTVYSEMLPR